MYYEEDDWSYQTSSVMKNWATWSEFVVKGMSLCNGDEENGWMLIPQTDIYPSPSALVECLDFDYRPRA